MDVIKRQVAILPKSAAVLYHLMFQDAAGNKYLPADVARELAAVSSVPVITGYDHFIGTGAIGGYTYSIDQQTKEAVKIGLRILRGESASSIPISSNLGSSFIFDYPALKRFDIPLSSLPENSIVKNRSYSDWEDHRIQLICIGAAFAVLVILLLLLASTSRRLKQSTISLNRLNASLENAVEERTLVLNQTNILLEKEIIERKNTEVELRRTEKFALDTLDAMPANICVLDNEGKIIAINQRWRDFASANPPVPDNYCLGASYLTVCNAACSDNDSDARLFSQGLASVLAGECDSYEHEYPCHSATEQRWFRAMVTRFAGIDKDRIVVSHLNITKRKHYEIELHKSRDEWKRTFDAMADLIFIIDDKQNILRINQSACNAFGISEDQAESTPCYVYMHGTDKPPESCPHLKSMNDHDKHQVDALVERLGQHYQVTTTPFFDADGNYEATVHVAHDISIRKRHEHELEQATDKRQTPPTSPKANSLPT